jgi:hypothetical protein
MIGQLHHTILSHVVEKGFAPSTAQLARLHQVDTDKMVEALRQLQDYHGVVLHPHEPSVWVIHPFSLAPTNFLVRSSKGVWWGNCAWCSLGVAALLKEDVTITTNLGAHDEQVVIHIKDGVLQEKDLVVHFPIPMQKAWDNVIYTCSAMLVFRDESQIDAWVERHHIPKGDVQPIDHVWAFARKWYGNHLDVNWRKWTMEEAREIFKQFGLAGRIWELEATQSRF